MDACSASRRRSMSVWVRTYARDGRAALSDIPELYHDRRLDKPRRRLSPHAKISPSIAEVTCTWECCRRPVD
jgi:hypothetical protein